MTLCLRPKPRLSTTGSTPRTPAPRGCSTCCLETFSCQAPTLNRSLGCEAAVALEGFVPGLVKHLMLRHSAGHCP